MHGSPGERARVIGLLRVTAPILLVMAAAGYLTRAAFPRPSLSFPRVGALFLVLAVALAWAMAASRRRLAAFVKGARGEEAVAHELAFLPDAYHVFHGLAASAAPDLDPALDLDHVVVGPTGVFVVETKNWRGRVTVRDGAILCDGQPPSRSPIEQVKTAAGGLRRALRDALAAEVEVQPIVCFAAGGLESGVEGVAGVRLCPTQSLNARIVAPPETPLPAETVGRIVALLEKRIGEGAGCFRSDRHA